MYAREVVCIGRMCNHRWRNSRRGAVRAGLCGVKVRV